MEERDQDCGVRGGGVAGGGGVTEAADVQYIWRNIVQSPSPICMFYFAHPLNSPADAVANAAAAVGGDNTTRNNPVPANIRPCPPPGNFVSSCGNYNRTKDPSQPHLPTASEAAVSTGAEGDEPRDVRGHVNETDRIRLASFVPWARETWSREGSIIAPLTELVAKRKGHTMPDVETMLRMIRVAWHTPPPPTEPKSPRLSRFNSESALKKGSQERDEPEQRQQQQMNSGVGEGAVQTERDAVGLGAAAESGGVESTAEKATMKRQPRRHQRRFSVPETFMRRHNLMLETDPESFELPSVPSCCLVKLYRTEATAVAAPTTTSASIDSFIPCCCDSTRTTVNSTPNNNLIDFRHPVQGVKAQPPQTPPIQRKLGVAITPNSNCGCGFLDVRYEAVESPPGSDRLATASSLITRSVLCSSCCTRLFSVHETPMDYFHNQVQAGPPPPRSPRHNSNQRHYRSMFLTSADNSLLSPAGDFTLPRSENVDKKPPLSLPPVQTLTVPGDDGGGSDKSECADNNGTDKSAAGTSKTGVITTSVVKAVAGRDKPPKASTAHMTMDSSGEQRQPHKHQQRQQHHHELHCQDNHQKFGTKTEQRVLTVNYNPQQTRELWSRGRNEGPPPVVTATATVVTSATMTTATVTQMGSQQQRACPGCECERKIDQYISEMLIENLHNTEMDEIGTESDRRIANNRDAAEEFGGQEEEYDGEQHFGNEAHGQREVDCNEVEEDDNDEEQQQQPSSFEGIGHQENANEQGRRNSHQGPHNEARVSNTRDNAQTPDAHPLTTDRLTYIPCYTNERNEIILGPVSAGSVYPDVDFDTAILVPRLSAYPRSESMEVRSSASGERQPAHLTLDSAEENLSLVDSLEGSMLLTSRGRRIDEEEDADDNEQQTKLQEQLRRAQSIENATTQNVERPEAFFVPIGRSQYQEDLNIAKKMPSTIRERLNLRQRRRNFKREQDLVRKNHSKVAESRLSQRLCEMQIDPSKGDSKHSSSMRKNKKFMKNNSSLVPSQTMTVTKYHPAVIPLSPPSSGFVPVSGRGMRAVQSDIGLLKSYTIDSKGNMQFQVPSAINTKGYFAKIATLKTSFGKKLRKKGVSFEHHQQMLQPFRSHKKQSESLTLYPPGSGGTSLTPDADKGPRRIYQKTEIQDGEKRIEILEIVECASSSNNNSARNQSPAGTGPGSRIPRPVMKGQRYFESTPSNSQTPTTLTASSATESTATTATTTATTTTATASSQDPNDSDQFVSELLIENLKTNNFVPEQQSNRRPPTGPKFTQMFDVIPEEKSSAMSHDSTAEERSDKDTAKGRIGQMAQASTTAVSAQPPKRLSAFTVLGADDADEALQAPPLPPPLSSSFKRDNSKQARSIQSHYNINGSVVKKTTRPHANREQLPKAKPVRETTSIAAKGRKRVDGGREQKSLARDRPQQQQQTHKQHKKQQQESNYTTPRTDSTHYDTPITTTCTDEEQEVEEEEEEGYVEQDDYNTEDENEDAQVDEDVIRLGADNSECFKDYSVSNKRQMRPDDRASSKEAAEHETIQSSTFIMANSRRDASDGTIQKELSICRTHFESICGDSVTGTHSVCVQTEASDEDAFKGSMTTGGGAVATTSAAEDVARWIRGDRAFQELGKEDKEREKQSGTVSNCYRYPSEDVSIVNRDSKARTTGYKNGQGTHGEQRQEKAKEVDAESIHGFAIESESTPALPEDMQTNGTIKATETTRTSIRMSSATLSSTTYSIGPNAANTSATSSKAKASQAALNIWAQRQEAEGGEGEGEAEICRTQSSASRLDESDDREENNKQPPSGSRQQQYRTTCCNLCQFCLSKSPLNAPQIPANPAAKTSDNGSRCLPGSQLKLNGSQSKPKSSPSVTFGDSGDAAAGPGSSSPPGFNSGKHRENNCTTSSSTSTCCLCPSSAPTDCGCCIGCCCCSCSSASCHATAVRQPSCMHSSGDQNMDISRRHGASPSENSFTIACSTTCHSRSTTTTMTTKSVANNQVNQDTHSRRCRKASELIKSVRPDEGQVGVGTPLVSGAERFKDIQGGGGGWSNVATTMKEEEEDDNNSKINCPLAFKSIMEIGMDLDFNDAFNKGLSETKAQAETSKKGGVLKSDLGDYTKISPGKKSNKNREVKINKDKESTETKTNNNHERKTTTSKEDDAGVDREEEEDDEDNDKSTPDTVINNGRRQKSGPEDNATMRSSSSSSDNEAPPGGGGVIEWARRKKRKVQGRLNEEKRQRSIVGENYRTSNKNINRAGVGAVEGENDEKNNKANGSWSVTVAGCYHPNMAAPDLQMRLSFPGTRSAAVQSSSSSTQRQTHHSSSMGMMSWSEGPNPMRPSLPPPSGANKCYEEAMPELNLEQQQESLSLSGEEYNHQDKDSLRQVLPVIDLVPKRKSLMRMPPDDYHSYGRVTGGGVGIGGGTVTNGMMTNKTKSITKRTSRKSIKHIDCNVAVESATTTRTISRITKGQRGLSYHQAAMGATSSAAAATGVTTNHQYLRKKGYDSAAPQGLTSGRSIRQSSRGHQLSKGYAKGPLPPSPQMLPVLGGASPVDSCRLWLDSNQSTRRTEDLPCLSVSGNAIAPEAKPRVPTMSEKDLTRRHSSCFTRSRPFYA